MPDRSARLRHVAFTVMLLSGLSTGCFHARVYSGALPHPDALPIELRRASYLWGLVDPDSLAVDRSCPSGMVQVETRHTAGDVALTLLTLGIYSPLTLRVTCAR